MRYLSRSFDRASFHKKGHRLQGHEGGTDTLTPFSACEMPIAQDDDGPHVQKPQLIGYECRDEYRALASAQQDVPSI